MIDAFALPLPAEIPPGEYTLVMGFYTWPNLERLALTDGSDHAVLGRVRIAQGE